MVKYKYFSLATSIMGALFCLSQAMGMNLPCSTAGCSIYASYSLFGVSFYYYGAAGFVLLALLLAVGMKYDTEKIMSFFIAAGLIINAGFLGYQILFWRCASCEIAALFLGLTAAPLLRGKKRSSYARPVFIAWAFLFLIVGALVIKEVAVKPWIIYGNPSARVQVYFSPTCPSCKTTIEDILSRIDSPDDVALIPISKSDQDKKRIASFVEKYGRSCSQIENIFNESASDSATPLFLADCLNLEKNKMILAGLGAQSVPIVVVNGQIPEKSGLKGKSPFSSYGVTDEQTTGSCSLSTPTECAF